MDTYSLIDECVVPIRLSASIRCADYYTITGSWYTPNSSRNRSVISPSVA